jgi:putative redox protein
MAGRSPRSPIVVTHEGGVKFAAQVRDHRVVVDQPRHGGGEDAGPAPIELLGVSLGTCVALYVQQFCQSRGISHEGLRVEVDQQGAANPNRIGAFDVRIVLPDGVPEPHAAMLERVSRSCPAHNTLQHGADIAFRFEIGATADDARAALPVG